HERRYRRTKPRQHREVPSIFPDHRCKQNETCDRIELAPASYGRRRLGASSQSLEVLEIWKLRKPKQSGTQKTSDSKNQQEDHSFGQKTSSHQIQRRGKKSQCNSRIDDGGDGAGKQTQPDKYECLRRWMLPLDKT